MFVYFCAPYKVNETGTHIMHRIETQKAFLHETPIIERYVEVGPSRVLANMAKKQAAMEQHAESHTIIRQFLSSSDSRKEIFYEYDGGETDSVTSTAPSIAKADPPAERPAPSMVAETSQRVETGSSSTMATATVDDTPMTATDIIIAVVAQKLRKQFDEIPITKSIQELSGGMSDNMLILGRLVTNKIMQENPLYKTRLWVISAANWAAYLMAPRICHWLPLVQHVQVVSRHDPENRFQV